MREFRAYRQTIPELRAVDGGVVLEGYAAVFNRYSQNLGGFVEQIDPAAFTDALTRTDGTVGLFNHDPNNLLGTVASGTLTLEPDNIGLRYAIPIDMEDPDGQRVAAKARSRKLRGSSFSFTVAEGGAEWSTTDQGFPLRTIRNISTLYDVGPVTFPAFLQTQDEGLAVALRSLADTTGRDIASLIEAARGDALAPLLAPAGDPTPPTAEQHSRSTSVRRWTATARNH